MTVAPLESKSPAWNGAHLAALIFANVSMGIGPLFVRLADTGPAATGFWRHVLALPLLAALLVMREPSSQWRLRGSTKWVVWGGGVLFGLNLAFAYIGFGFTRLGNIVLLGNSGGIILMIWGVIALRRMPRLAEATAILCALSGAGLLLSGSLQLSVDTFKGDLLGVMSGICYAGYLLLLRHARAGIGQFTLLFWVTMASMPVLLVVALTLGESIVPHVWWPIIGLTLSGQLIGQGLLIYSLRHFSALVIGLVLLTQPAISAAIGWIAFGEVLSAADMVGMALLAAALVIARAKADQSLPARRQAWPRSGNIKKSLPERE